VTGSVPMPTAAVLVLVAMVVSDRFGMVIQITVRPLGTTQLIIGMGGTSDDPSLGRCYSRRDSR